MSAGFSLVELVLVLGLIGLLGGLAGASLNPGGPALGAVQGELRAGVEQGFLLARARGCRVRVALGGVERGHAPARHGVRKDCGEREVLAKDTAMVSGGSCCGSSR